jgi:hypothetical protein
MLTTLKILQNGAILGFVNRVGIHGPLGGLFIVL